MKKRARFKTQEEFEEHALNMGYSDWRKVYRVFTKEMDYLLGQPLDILSGKTEELINASSDRESAVMYDPHQNEHWYISREMLIVEDVEDNDYSFEKLKKTIGNSGIITDNSQSIRTYNNEEQIDYYH
jgi:hypothetical protein